MIERLTGKPVSDAIKETISSDARLAIIRIGEKPEDMSYERSAAKKLTGMGLRVTGHAFPENISVEDFKTEFEKINDDPEQRHGIVLTATYPAKKQGVKVGMAVWQAKQQCPGLICVKPDYGLYMHFSDMLAAIWHEYSDRVEAFGLDESWIDVSAPDMDIEKGGRLADELRERVRRELGITVSIGVADNKVFAKLGSDMKKPDGTTVLRPERTREQIWPLPVSDLLYVGPATARRLRALNIYTIGDLARVEDALIFRHLGKNGMLLCSFARGEDRSPVRPVTAESVIKSIGNSMTAPRDILCAEDAECVLTLLSESVAARMREHGFRGGCLTLSIRSTDLSWRGCQQRLKTETDRTDVILSEARKLFYRCFPEPYPLRGMGLSCSSLSPADTPVQLSFYEDAERLRRAERLDRTVDDLRKRFGPDALLRGNVLRNAAFSGIHPKEDHTIHPVAMVR